MKNLAFASRHCMIDPSSGAAIATNNCLQFLAVGSGTSASPGSAVLLAGAVRTYTDGRSNDWEARYDWTGFGKTMGDLDPRGYLWVTHRDEDGLASMFTDSLDRNSLYYRDSNGNVTTKVHAGYGYDTFTYNSFSQVTQHTDAASKSYSFTTMRGIYSQKLTFPRAR